MLTQIDFQSFRGFRRLTLEGFPRVNLVVGKNNSGKTSFLEGLAVLANPGGAPEQFKQLRQMEQSLVMHFQSIQYATWVVHDESLGRVASVSGHWKDAMRHVRLVPKKNADDVILPELPAPERLQSSNARKQQTAELVIPSCVVAAQQRSPDDLLGSFGAAMRRRNGEELLESRLRAVDPRIRKVRIAPSGPHRQIEIVVDIGLSRLVPLSQVGQGIYRLVEVFSEIIGTEAKIAFVDEIESGIHHTCLSDVWRGIAEAASEFEVQIFATTHSHECIEAAHAVFAERDTYDFGIIQLFREADDIQGRVLQQEKIAAAIAGDIDLRA